MPPNLVAASTALQTVVYAVLLWKLVRSGLAPIYIFFTALVLFEPVRAIVALAIPRGSTLYGWFYILTQPIQWLLYALVTLEVYKSVFRSLSGISRLTRYVIVAATGFAIVVSSLSLTLQSDASSPFRPLELYLSLERSMFLSLLTFVLMLVIFLSWYPIPVHRNAVVYCGVFALYFGIKTAALLVRTMAGPDFVLAANIANMIASLASCVLWIVLLTPAGETRRAKPVHRMSPEDEERLVAHLESINRTLLRSVPE